MRKELFIALRLTLVMTLFTGGLYPAAVWTIGRLCFPREAAGSFVVRDGKVVGSRLIGQRFTQPGHFHPRPSAAGAGYDATASGGDNLGPTSDQLKHQVRDAVAAWRAENPTATGPVPADAATTSGSGLDPHISPENAKLQIPRVAAATGLAPAALEALVVRHTEGRRLGVWGEPRVNVLELNLDVDAAREAARKAGG